MLDETLIVWGGEFGRTAYCQGTLTKDTTAIITRAASPPGWLVAVLNPVSLMAEQMTTATTLPMPTQHPQTSAQQR